MDHDPCLSFHLHNLDLEVPKALVDAYRPSVAATRPNVARVREQLDAELIEAFGKLAPDAEDIEVLDAESAAAINRLVVVMLAMGETAHPAIGQSRMLH